MAGYKITGGEMRLLAAIFDHLKPYAEQAKNRRSVAVDDGEEILETYYGLLQGALVWCLDARERTIIEKRYGLLYSGKCYTHEEIAPKSDLTRERICQIETLALCKIKRHMTELNDEETAAATSLLDAKAQELLGHAIGAKVQDDATSGDVYTHKWLAHTNAMNKLKIQQKMREFRRNNG